MRDRREALPAANEPTTPPAGRGREREGGGGRENKQQAKGRKK